MTSAKAILADIQADWASSIIVLACAAALILAG